MKHPLARSASTTLVAMLLFSPLALRAEDAPEQSAPSEAQTTERLFGRGLAGQLTLSGGIQFSSGDYTDDATTDLLYFPLSIAYSFDSLGLTPTPYDLVEFKLSIPFLYVKGPGSVLTDSPEPMLSARGGIGDIIVAASYVYLPRRESPLPVFELTGKAKIPTASASKALGTGAAAYSLQLELSKTFRGKFTPIVMGGYRFADSAENFRLNDSGFASVGLDYRITGRWSGGVFYDYYQAPSLTSADAHEISPYIIVRFGRGFRLAPNAVIGLSKGSPDYAIGLQLRYTLPILR